jgi:hypothetical protein
MPADYLKSSMTTSPVLSDLGLEGLIYPEKLDEEERKKRERMLAQRNGIDDYMDGRRAMSFPGVRAETLMGGAAYDIFGTGAVR